MLLQDKVAIVSGIGPGMGRDISLRLARHGADVVLAARSPEKLASVAEEVEALERVCILFDGADQVALERARNQWRDLTKAGVAAQYWAEEGGRWVKKAESGG